MASISSLIPVIILHASEADGWRVRSYFETKIEVRTIGVRTIEVRPIDVQRIETLVVSAECLNNATLVMPPRG